MVRDSTKRKLYVANMKEIEELFNERIAELHSAKITCSEHLKIALQWGIDELEVMKENVLAKL